MFCTQCGSKNAPESKFCTNCGIRWSPFRCSLMPDKHGFRMIFPSIPQRWKPLHRSSHRSLRSNPRNSLRHSTRNALQNSSLRSRQTRFRRVPLPAGGTLPVAQPATSAASQSVPSAPETLEPESDGTARAASPNRKLIIGIAVAAVLLVAAVVAGIVTYNMELWGGKSLPDVAVASPKDSSKTPGCEGRGQAA